MTREEAIDFLKADYPDSCYEELREAFDMAIQALQEPGIKHSKWINMGTCSVCASCRHIEPVPYFPPYCKNCGALMDGRQEGELE